MLAVKTVLLNSSTGLITLPNEDFVIEPKVSYTMTPCEYGHTMPIAWHDCGITTTLDVDLMKAVSLRKGQEYDRSRLPMLAVFQVLGWTIPNEQTHTLRSQGLFYFGFVMNRNVPSSLYAKHHAEYQGYIYDNVPEFLRHLVNCGFDYNEFTGFFKGYTRG